MYVYWPSFFPFHFSLFLPQFNSFLFSLLSSCLSSVILISFSFDPLLWTLPRDFFFFFFHFCSSFIFSFCPEFGQLLLLFSSLSSGFFSASPFPSSLSIVHFCTSLSSCLSIFNSTTSVCQGFFFIIFFFKGGTVFIS